MFCKRRQLNCLCRNTHDYLRQWRRYNRDSSRRVHKCIYEILDLVLVWVHTQLHWHGPIGPPVHGSNFRVENDGWNIKAHRSYIRIGCFSLVDYWCNI